MNSQHNNEISQHPTHNISGWPQEGSRKWIISKRLLLFRVSEISHTILTHFIIRNIHAKSTVTVKIPKDGPSGALGIDSPNPLNFSEPE